MHLRTLGGFELTDTGPDGTAVLVMGAQKPLALLAYLALSTGRRASRDTLQDLLWSDTDPDRARKTLRQTVWSLRQRLGDDALRSENDDLVLALPLSVDSQEFEQAAGRGDLAGAWALYRGHFIPAFAAPGGAGFEHWADLQREHFRATWMAVGEELVRTELATRSPREAVVVARRLRDELPDRADLWRTLLQGLLASGDRLQALVEAEALEAMLRSAGTRPDSETRALLDRIHSLPPDTTSGVPERPRADLVGREQVFASLLTAWHSAASGHGRAAVIRGAAGLGKTRLLHDFHQRLAGIGVRTVLVRARPADRDLPFGLLATLAETVARLPGAVGVSPAAASALVDLSPSLSNVFPSTDRTPRDADELVRLRTLALTELIQTAAEETPVALLVDDLHWADEISRQVLASLCGRIGDLSVLIVVTLRPLRGGWSAPQGADLVDLQPLSLGQLEDLVASMAASEPALLTDLGRLLYTVSAGVPLLALAAIELALDRRLLWIDGDHWECPNPDQLRQELAQGSALEQLLHELPSGGLELILALALAGRPLDDELLAAVVRHPGGSALAAALEQRGLILRLGGEWDVAHDKLAEAALTTAGPALRQDVTHRLGRVLLDGPDRSPRALRLAGRLLVQAGDPEGQACFRHWLDLSRRHAYWRDPVRAAADFLGDEATVDLAQTLAGGVPRWARFTRGYPQLAVAAGMVALVGLGVGSLVALERWFESPAATMVITEPSTSRGFLWDTSAASYQDPSVVRNRVPITVQFHDRDGKPTRNAPESVEVRLLEDHGVMLEGGDARLVRQGQAEFQELAVVGRGAFRLEVRAGRVAPARTHRFYASGGLGGTGEARLTIVGGAVNGQQVDSLRRSVVVTPGELLEGKLRYRILTDSRDAAILMGAVAVWGDRRRNWIVLSALPSHGAADIELRLVDAITGERFRAPLATGRYWLVFLMDTETEMKFIASRTNWIVGEPRWFDGDDIVDLSAAELRSLDSTGSVVGSKLLRPASPGGPDRRDETIVIGTTLEIVVARR